MSSYFSSIGVRANGQSVTYEWFNALRTAGAAIEALLSSLASAETEMTIANNQAAANITGVVYSGATYAGYELRAFYRRKTDSSERVGHVTVKASYRTLTTVWEISEVVEGGDASGITFSIDTATGQLKYATDNQAGANYVGELKHRVTTYAI